jgi:hypothetical protein
MHTITFSRTEKDRQDRHGESDMSDIRQTNLHAWLPLMAKVDLWDKGFRVFIAGVMTCPYRSVFADSIQIFEALKETLHDKGKNRQHESWPRRPAENMATGNLACVTDWSDWEN